MHTILLMSRFLQVAGAGLIFCSAGLIVLFLVSKRKLPDDFNESDIYHPLKKIK
jgi:ABC-type nickel/cobalt efflux system permease component RcnA